MNNRYINIKEIGSKLLRHPFLQSLSLEDIVQYTVDFISIVGLPDMLIDKIKKIDIKEYRGLLPCDFISLIQVKDEQSQLCLPAITDSFYLEHTQENNRGCEGFKIQGNVIFTTFREGEVTLSYKAIPLDEDGFPLLPDESKFLKALELYIKKEYFTILFDMNKIQRNVLENTQQEYAWRVGQCMNHYTTLSVERMESFTKMWTNILPQSHRFKTGFKR